MAKVTTAQMEKFFLELVKEKEEIPNFFLWDPKYRIISFLLKWCICPSFQIDGTELEFLNSLWGLGTEYKNMVVVPARKAT